MDSRAVEKLHSLLMEVVEEQLEKNVFSGCCIGVLDGGNKYVFHFGKNGSKKDNADVEENSFFDLASLTKPLVTSLCLLSLAQSGELSLEEPLDNFFRLRGEHHKQITLHHLAEHAAGFAAHRAFYRELSKVPLAKRKERLLELILSEGLVYLPGKGFLYSDLGFMLLGLVIEKVSGLTLDRYWKKEIISPLGLENGLDFTNSSSLRNTIFCATGVCPWSNMELYGRVNDDNCRALGGVAGHAGLFATGPALLGLCEKLLKIYTGEYQHPAFSLEPVRERFEEGVERWALGFDTPTGVVSSSGRYFSPMTIGHLGFTGTSFWIDLLKQRGVIFLTNRVLSTKDMSHIQALRPRIHDIIMAELTGRLYPASKS